MDEQRPPPRHDGWILPDMAGRPGGAVPLLRPGQPVLPGDRFTIEGCYVRRTLWQWLTQQPRQLQVFYCRPV